MARRLSRPRCGTADRQGSMLARLMFSAQCSSNSGIFFLGGLMPSQAPARSDEQIAERKHAPCEQHKRNQNTYEANEKRKVQLGNVKFARPLHVMSILSRGTPIKKHPAKRAKKSAETPTEKNLLQSKSGSVDLGEPFRLGEQGNPRTAVEQSDRAYPGLCNRLHALGMNVPTLICVAARIIHGTLIQNSGARKASAHRNRKDVH